MISKTLRLSGLFLRLVCENLICLSVVQRKVDNILLVKTDAIGDFVVWLGFVKLLRRKFPSDYLYLVCNKVVAGMASSSGYFDAVITIEFKRFQSDWLYRFKMLRRIRQVGCQIAIQPTYSRSFLLGESIIRCCGARHRIGSSGDTSNMSVLKNSSPIAGTPSYCL